MLFCTAVGAYLVSVILAARLGLWLTGALPASSPTAVRLLLGALALDLTKLPGSLLGAWLIAPAVSLSPRVASLVLTLLLFGLDALVTVVLGQASWLMLDPVVLLCRLAIVALFWVALTRLFRCRQLRGKGLPR